MLDLHFVTYGATGGFVQLLMALRRGDVVAFQTDRGTGHRRDMPVTFFGTPLPLAMVYELHPLGSVA